MDDHPFDLNSQRLLRASLTFGEARRRSDGYLRSTATSSPCDLCRLPGGRPRHAVLPSTAGKLHLECSRTLKPGEPELSEVGD
jgi:hypothetical protein